MHKNHLNACKAPRKTDRSVLSALFFAITLLLSFIVVAYFFVIPEKVPGLGMLLFKGELNQIVSPKTGTVISWLKEEGDTIAVGDNVAVIVDHETDKTLTITAPQAGVIAEIIVFGNTSVEKGQGIAVISHDGDPRHDLELTGFVSSFDGKKIKPGMLALIDPTITKAQSQGLLKARVKRVGKLPVTKAAILSMLKIPEVADFIRSQIQSEPFVVILEPIQDQITASGYAWTGPGPDNVLDSGIFGNFYVFVHEQRLISMLMPSIFWSSQDS